MTTVNYHQPRADTEVSGLIDIHAVLVRFLRADAGVAQIAGQRVYARSYHERQTFPACRIVFPAQTAATVPAPAWWTYDGQIDCHADNHQMGFALAQQVQRALLALEGSGHPEGVIQVVDAFSVQSGFDEEFTPPKPRWIVEAAITARPR